MEMLALRSTCGLTHRPVPFSVLEGHRGRPQPLDFGHVPCRNWALDVGRKRVGFANAVRAVRKIGPLRKAELFGLLPRPSTLFASFLLLD